MSFKFLYSTRNISTLFIVFFFQFLSVSAQSQNNCVVPYNPTPASTWGIVQKFQSNTVIWNGGTPTAADLNGDGISEILAPANDFSGYYVYKGDGSNKTTATKDFVITTSSTRSVQPAIANIIGNSSSAPEVVMVNTSGFLYIFSSTGGTETNYLYKSTTTSQYTTEATPYIVDIDQDGTAEIVLGNDVFGIVGNALVKRVAGPALGYIGQTAGSTGTPVDVIVADIISTNPGKEIIYGSRVYGVNLTTGVTTKLKDLSTIVGSSIIAANDNGPTAVGDMNGDGKLDIVYNGSTFVVMWDPNGTNAANTLLFRRVPPSFNYGTRGLPLIANVYNDITTGSKTNDYPEAIIINSVSGSAGIVTAYNLNFNTTAGTTTQHIWSLATNDMSGCTGITAFDFDGNGIREIVYRDQSTLRIINGNRSTPVNYANEAVASSTWGEYPIVADLNNDGQAEIAVTGNNMLQVFGSDPATFLWKTAPNYWNQRNYRIVNINSDLTVPTTEINAASVIAYNNNAAQFQFADAVGSGVASGSTNLADAQITINTVTTNCPTITIAATISNTGTYLLPIGTYVTMYDANPTTGTANLIGTYQTTAIIAAGASATVTMTANLASASSTIFAVVNDRGTTARPFNLSSWTSNTGINECSYTNNISSKTFTCLDSDSDAVPDFTDIDDDNDGILDVIEMTNCNSSLLITPSSATSSPVYGGSVAARTIDGSGFTGSGLSALASAPAVLEDSWLLKEPLTSGFIEYNLPGNSNIGGVVLWAPDANNYGGGDAPPKDFTVEITYSNGQVFTTGIYTTEQPNGSGSNRGAQPFYFPQTFLNATKVKLNLLNGWYDINNNSLNQVSTDGITVSAAYNMFLSEFRVLCGATDIDTDNDGIPNRLDLDSDGDGCPDAKEAGVIGTLNNGIIKNGSNGSVATTTSGVAGSIANGGYGTNGFADDLETVVDNGIYSSAYNYGYAIYAGTSACIDSDGDSVADVFDLDDDNDGVLDQTESSSCSTTPSYTFRNINGTTTGAMGYNAAFPSWMLNSFTESQDGYKLIFDQPVSDVVLQFASIYQDDRIGDFTVKLKDGTIIAGLDFNLLTSHGPTNSIWTPQPNNTGNFNGNFTKYFGAPFSTSTPYFRTTIANTGTTQSWGIVQLKNIAGASEVGISELSFRIIGGTATSGTGGLAVFASCFFDQDTDNDGISNRLDLDSDGDGCPDALEAGVSGTLTTGTVKNGLNGVVKTTSTNVASAVATGTYGLNGLADGVETAAESGVISYTSKYEPFAINRSIAACKDTDGDGVFDINDIDDDNDGVLDITEYTSCTTPLNAIAPTTDGAIANFGTNTAIFKKIAGTLSKVSTRIDGSAIDVVQLSGTTSSGSITFDRSYMLLNLVVADIDQGETISLKLYDYQNNLIQLSANDIIQLGSNVNVDSYNTGGNSITLKSVSSSASFDGSTSNVSNIKLQLLSVVKRIEFYKTAGANNTWVGLLSGCDDSDTDKDGIPNHLDLDSDGDGCSDAIEAKSSTTAASTTVYPTFNSGDDTNTNGLLNVYESTTAGVINYTSLYVPFATSVNLAACKDTDADGISDDTDLDDDNDGILDAVESPNCFYSDNDWHYGNRSDIKVTSGLSMTSPQNQPQKLVDGKNGGVSYDVRMETTTTTVNALGSGRQVYMFNMIIPVKLSKILLGYTGIYSHFNDNTRLILRGSNDGVTWTNLSGTSGTPEVSYDATINANSATETSTIYPYPATTSYATSANIFSVTQNAAKYQYYDIYWFSGGGINNTGYANEVYFDVASDYIPSAHPKIDCSNDTDGDGILNHQDLDSDGDACPDAKEASIRATLTSATVINLAGATIASGTATSTLDNAIVSGTGTSTFGNNGFVNSLETSSETGIYSGTYNYSFATNKLISTCLDSDSDGVADVLDLDDDNDGVLDIVECPVPGKQPLLSRFDIASGASKTVNFTGFPEELWIDIWTLDNNFNLKVNNVDITNVSELNFAPLGASYPYPKPYTDIVRTNGTAIYPSGNVWTYPNTAQYPLIRVKISKNGYSKIYGYDFVNGTGNYNELVLVDAVYQKVPINLTGNNTIVISQDNTWAPSNLNAEFNTYSSAGICDTDGDGQENRLDLDSDNDGCSDALESKTTTSTSANFQYTSSNNAADFGNNGFYNTLETVTDNGIYNGFYPYDYAINSTVKGCIDSDTDGVPDLFDLDDDNDGILDAIESPTCFYSLAELSKPVAVSSDLNPYDATGTYAVEKSIDGLIATYSVFKSGQYLANNEILKYTANGLIDITSLTLDLDFRAISTDASSTFRFQGSADNVIWDNLNTAAIASTTTTFPSTLLLANDLQAGKKYKYFRLYGVSGTSNFGGVANATFNLASSNRPSANPKLTCNNDTDVDGIPNHLDLDADGDGCPDAKEAGVIGTLTTGSVVNLTTASGTATSTTNIPSAVASSTYGLNGFANALETGTESGNYSGSYNYDFAINKLLSACLDTDSDGVTDLIDIDDDNDGILDAVESPTCFYNRVELSIPVDISTELLPYSTGTIEKGLDGNAATAAYFYPYQKWVGKEIFKYSAITQIPITSIDVDLVSWGLSENTSQTFKLQGSNDNTIWSDLSGTLNSTTNTGTFSFSNTLLPNAKFKFYRVIGVAGTSYYGGVLESRFVLSNSFVQSQYTKSICLTGRNDADLVPNHLDLDSDGDGCADAIEAGTSTNTSQFTSTNYAADFGANGFYNALEKTAAESNLYKGVYTYEYAIDALYNACTDSDGDGVADLLDIDDDNDGILDAIESPTCFYTTDELKNPTTISSELVQYSSYVIGNAIDGVATSASAFAYGQDWVGKEIFKFTAKGYTLISGMSFDLVNWALSSATGSTFKLQGSGDNMNWTDLSTPTYSSATTGTFTISNTLATTTKFKYYRLVGVAGLNSYGGVYEARFNIVSSTTASANPKSTCLTGQTDGDLIPNHLDLDSDGDGCSDALESGTTSTTTVNYKFTGTAADFGANGFYNALEKTNAESNLYKGAYTYYYATDNSINVCLDSDGDGTKDVIDLDDDNDGVLDYVEQFCEGSVMSKSDITVSSAVNWYFQNAPAIGLNALLDGSLIQQIYPTESAIANKTVYQFNFLAPKVLNLIELANVSGQTPFIAGGTYKIQGSNDEGTTWTDIVSSQVVANTAPILATTNSIKFNMPVNYKAFLSYRIYAISMTGQANWSTEAYFREVTCEDINTDGDATPNRLDLDSDGDGCPDAVEAGSTYISTSGITGAARLTTSIIPSAPNYGNNGFANGLETSTESGAYTGTYTYDYAKDANISGCSDTDGDGVTDVLDLDDDNDGVLDTVECPNVSTNILVNGTFDTDKTGWTASANWAYYSPGFLWNSTENVTNDLISQTFAKPIIPAAVTTVDVVFDVNTNGYGWDILSASTASLNVILNNKIYATLSNPSGGTTASVVALNGATVNVTSIDIVANMVPTTKIIVKIPKSALANTNTLSFSFTATSDDFGIDNVFIGKDFDACDKDGDGIINSKDLDSDGDGCPDAVEAGTTFRSTSGVANAARLTTSIIPAPYGNNGFANGLETTTESGLYTGTYTYDYAIDANTNACKDTDGDGVPDVTDLDDDNDGVLDSSEQINCVASGIDLTTLTYNGTSITAKTASSFTTAGGGGDTWKSSYSNENLKLPISLKFNHASTTGFEMFGLLPAATTQTPGDWVDGAYKFYGTGTTIYGYFLTAWDPNAVAILPTDILSIDISTSGMVTVAINGITRKTFQGQVSDYKLALSSYRASSLTNIILTDATRTAKLNCTDLDTDTDGIPNRLDLDSDGDGCPDAAEAGTTIIPTSGVALTARYTTSVIPAPYGNNGFANGLERTSESGTYTGTYTYNLATDASLNTCLDNDNDGVPDVLDLDDDNDGVLDTIEDNCSVIVVNKTGAIITKPSTINYNFNGNAIANLIDGVDNNVYVVYGPSGTLNGPWFNFEFPSPKVLTYLEIGHYVGQTLFSTTSTYKIQGSTDNTNWADVTGTLTYNNNNTSTSGGLSNFNSNIANFPTNRKAYKYYRILGINASSGGTWATEIYFKEFVCAIADLDGDGIPNRLDLDSDGDGCPDAKEAGVNGTLSSGSVKNGSGGAVTSTTTVANAIAAGPYGNNGLANGVETSTESGVVTYTSTYANIALVKDLVAPTITSQPLNRTVFVGATAVLTTTAGTPPANRTFTYQWYKAGVAIAGANSATYTVTTSATTANVADYYCTIGFVNSCFSTNTNTVNITVLTNPVGLTACQDASAVLSVTKTGNNVVTYQWRKSTTNLVNGANIAGVTTSSLTLTNLALADAGAYTLVATDANGAVITSLAGTITITNNTKYVLPATLTTCATTSTINLASSVLTGTSGATSIKWQRSKDGGNTWSDITSSLDASITYTNFTTATLGITAANTTASSSLNGYQYRIASINASCTNYSNVETITINTAPTITVQPSNSVLCNVFGTSFTAAATGANLTYRWQTRAPSGTWTTITGSNASSIDNGVVYSNFLTATLNLSAAPATENNNEYQVLISNSCGTVTSTTAVLNPTVATPTLNTNNIAVCEGDNNITLIATSTTPSRTYQWYLNGTTIGGATASIYNPTSSGNYSVIANATGFCKSGTATATVTINPLPLVAIAQGAVLTLSSGSGGIDLTANAIPALFSPSSYNYTWYKDGISESGPASTNTYRVNLHGSYTVRATNTSTTCFATSPATTITVLPSVNVNGSSAICADGSVAMSVALTSGQTIQWESTTDVGTYSYTAITGANSATYTATPTNITSAPISITYRAVISGTGSTGTTNAIVVTANPIPTAIISNTASGTSLCAGTEAVLTASSGAASATYQWYNNNTIITGATASTYTATSSGNYSFKVTDISCDCSANSISSTVTVVSPPAAPNLTATSKIICVNTTADLTVFQPLAITGVSYEWHSASNTLTSTLVADATKVGTAGTYYLFAKNNTAGCFSNASVAFTLSIENVGQATLTAASTPTYTIGDIAIALNASTSTPTYSLRWYTASTGGVALTAPVLPSTATAGITNYYVEQYDGNASFCTSNPRQLAAVTVKPLAPTVTNITYCQNETAVALTATPATGGTLNWYGTAATGGTLTTTATIPATGTATNTTYYVSQTVNGVEGARAALTVTINAAPSAPSVISGTFSVTSTNSYTYSVTSVANTTYQWTLPSFMSGTSTTNSISALVNAAGTGTINVIAINANGCLSPATTSNVTAVLYVAAVPVANNASYTIGDPSNPANTASQITAATGATLNYYTSNAAGSTSTSEQSIPATAGVYTYYVSQTINGVESALVPYTVTIKPQKPIVADITYCQNDMALALTATGTDIQWYSVATSGTATSTAPTPSTGTATNTTYYVTQTVNGVESDRIALVVTINPTPATPSTITGRTTTSTESSEIYEVTNDANATGYAWVLPNGWTGTSSINSITATVGLSGGQIKVKAISGSCASPFSTLTVGILNITNPPLTTNVIFVTGSTPSSIASNTTALITGTSSATLNFYTSNEAGTASSSTQTTPTTPGVYTYYVSQTSSIGVESILVPYTITIKPIAPPINTNNDIIGNAITYCKGASAFALTATTSAGGTLKWYTVATGGASSNSPPTPSTSLVGTTNYYVSQVVNGVESDRVLIVVTVNDAPSSVTATATQPTCTNSSGYIVITSPLGTGFTYSVDGSNYTNTTLFSALPAGNYFATAKNNLGCLSAPTSITINTAVAPPLSPLVSVVQPTCSITTGSISITSTTLSTDTYSIDGGLNYQASKLFTNVAPGTYTVTTLNAGGCVSAGTSATVNAALAIPAQPIISSSSASGSICAGTTVSLTSSALTGNQWYKNGELIAGAINQTYAPNESGNYTVIATNASGCASIESTAETITFNPLPTPVISNGATLAFDNCTTTVITLTASNTNTSTGNTYQWYLNGNSINVGGNNSTYNANQAGNYSVVITNNGCSATSPISKLIAAPSVNAANTAFCEGGSALLSGNSTGFTNPTYQWKVSTNDGLSFVNATGAGTTSLTYTATTAGKYQLEVTDVTSNGTISSTSCAINVTVFTNPTATITASPSAAVCVGSTISLNANAASGTASYTYQWLIAGGNDIAGAALSTYTTGVAGSYAVKVTDANGCVVNAAPSTINFNAVPTAPVVTITNPTCEVATGTISVTAPLGAGYTYSIDGTNYSNTTGLFTGVTPGLTYNVTVKSSTGCTSNATVATIAAALVVPATPVITGPDNINPFSLNTYSVAAVTGATSYSWNIPGYWSGVSTTNSITIKVDISSGSLSVTANSASCVSVAATKNITATILSPDVNVTNISVPVSGKLTTNDIVPAGTTYGQPGTNAANPTGASITVNANGSYTFTATTPGKYIYYVPVCAAGQTTGCPVSPLEITVVDPLVNTDNPVANNDFATVKSGTPSIINVLANDAAGNSDGTLNASSLSITSTPKHGVAVVNSDGTITYSSAAGFIGTDSLVYNICDNSAPTPICQVAVAYFKVLPTSAPSITSAVDDYASILSSPSGANAVSGNVLTNDINSAGTSLTATVVTGPTNAQGSFTMNADGSYTFTPTANFSGPVDITYTACTGATPAACATATIHILVEASSVINPDVATAYLNILATGNISTNDVLLSGTTYGQPAQQSGATITMNTDGTYDFTATEPGIYTYTIPVCAPGQTTNCPTQTLVITVPVNILVNDVASAYVNIPQPGSIATNNTVPTGTTYGTPVADPTNPAAGTGAASSGAVLTMTANGTYTFTATVAGTYTYTVPVCAPGQTSDCPTETIVFTVPVNTLVNDVATAYVNIPKTGSVATNDVVPTGTTYGTPIAGTTNPAAGTGAASSGAVLTMTANGTYTFTATVAGTYTYTVPVCAPGQTSDCPTETIVFTVPVNNLVNDVATAYVNIPQPGSIATNDVTPAGTTYGTPVADPTNPAAGTGAASSGAVLTMTANGTYTFTATVAGTYTYTVPVCAPGQTTNCPTTIIVFTVPVNTLVNDVATAYVNIPKTGSVATNDVVPTGTTYGSPVADPTNPAAGTGAASSGAVLIMTSNGTYTFTATVAGTYTYNVPVCAPGQTSNCPTTIIVFTVPVNTLVNDAATAYVNIPQPGSIATNDVTPAGTTYGTPVADPTNPAVGSGAASSGAVLTMTANGTYTFTATIAGTYTYTVPVCAPGQTTNCPTTTIVFTVIGSQPQGVINLKYDTLLASDSVHVKLKVYDGIGPYTMIFKNSINNRIDTVKNISDSTIVMLPPSSNDAIFTLIKIIDNGNNTRSNNFDKDTARLTILRPKILLTLKADLPTKLPDNSFKTKIVMKIKNNGALYLQNVQVNADLSKVFPADMQFILDSIKVASGNLALNPTYTGFGIPKAPSYVAKSVNGFSIKYRTLATLSGSDLFNDGVNLDINEEGSVVFYLTLKPGVNIEPLVLQFTSAGDGVLVQKDGNKSMQPATSVSHDNSNINAHPSVTTIGKPLPTYIPFFLVNEIGASLEASEPVTVNGGYVFSFKSTIKNYSNSNLDSVAASFDINQFIKVPDSASIYGTPTVIGTTSFNTKFDGKNDIQFFKGVSQLKVGDSIKIAFDLFIKTDKTKAIWPTYLIAKGITTTGDLRVTDTSTNGPNPDPNGNKIPNESVRTIIGIGLNPPPAPEVIAAVYEVDDKRNPKNIGQLVKKIPIGTIPTWCNVDGTACSFTPPVLPNIVGTYIWCVKALDTITGLTSTPCVYDTVQIIPINKYSKYDLIKSAKTIEYDLSGKFIIGFNIKVVNRTDRQIDSILVQDDLTKTFKRADGFKLLSITSSGNLVANNAFDGISSIELLKPSSYLAAYSTDSIVFKILIETTAIEGDYNNSANMKIWSDYGKLDLLSNDTVVNKNGLINRVATQFMVPKIVLNIPEGFSPNNDGIDDTWFIKHPFGMKLDVKVVNRWGNEVYANPDYKNDWRGKGIKNFLGEDLPEGTYFFIVQTIDRNGLRNKFVGPLTIIR